MSENEISRIVLESAIKIHKKLGPGILESVYEHILFYELTKVNGLFVEKQKPIKFFWEDEPLDFAFRLDLLVENKVIIELKSVESLNNVHYKQLLTYLKVTDLKLGLLINFNESLLKDGFKRIVNNL